MLRKVLLAVVMGTLGCWNPFSPPVTEPPGGQNELPPLDTPEHVLENLNYAMNHKDIEIYELVLDDDYWFREPNEFDDELDDGWGKERDVELVRKVFEFFDVFEYKLLGGQRWREFGSDTDSLQAQLGVNIEDKILEKGDPDDHPGEVWEVFSRPVDMYMYNYAEDQGYIVNQLFEFKMRKGKDGLWRIVRWTDYPWNP
ncbi:MAG TPA: hypothetical protein EYP17_10340 [Candidatus Latescibacteria bacterium]|nr:hypothetical protein [Candidatus Latescibacterota bacterium]